MTQSPQQQAEDSSLTLGDGDDKASFGVAGTANERTTVTGGAGDDTITADGSLKNSTITFPALPRSLFLMVPKRPLSPLVKRQIRFI